MDHTPKKIKIAVDDYGLHPSIDEAIYTLAQKGIVHKVSVMANASYTPTPLPSTIKTGLHIDLTTPRCFGGPPLAPSPFHLLKPRHLTTTEIEKRIQAQYNHLINQGFKITHIDTHQHIHLIPTILKTIITFAQTHNIPNIRTITLSARHIPYYIASLFQCGFFKQALKLQAIYLSAQRLKHQLKHFNASQNLILMPLAQTGNYPKLLTKFVHRFQHCNAELVTHPGLPKGLQDEPYIQGREIEYQSLLSLTDHPDICS